MAKRKKTNPRKKMPTPSRKAIEKRQINNATDLAMLVALMAAHDELELGPKRLTKLQKNIEKKYADIADGYYSINNAWEWFIDYVYPWQQRHSVDLENNANA